MVWSDRICENGDCGRTFRGHGGARYCYDRACASARWLYSLGLIDSVADWRARFEEKWRLRTIDNGWMTRIQRDADRLAGRNARPDHRAVLADAAQQWTIDDLIASQQADVSGRLRDLDDQRRYAAHLEDGYGSGVRSDVVSDDPSGGYW